MRCGTGQNSATKSLRSRILNLVRAVSTQGFGRIRYYRRLVQRLRTDAAYREVDTALDHLSVALGLRHAA